jgi:hypothetical protein
MTILTKYSLFMSTFHYYFYKKLKRINYKLMKRIKRVIAIGFITIMMSSCATVFGGKVTSYQKTKPAPGEQQREVRVGALIADIILFAPGLIVDFATGAIYKPKN